jgi:hypothetical protein
MRILFGALHNGYYRNIDSVVEELARRGHEIHLSAEREDAASGGHPIVERMTARFANVSCGRTAVRDPETLFLPAKIRFALDYLRYLEPMYSPASGLVMRARERTPSGMVRLSQSPLLAWGPLRRLVRDALADAERAAPDSPDIERFLDQQRPDLVVVTPLIGLVACSQLDLLRSALRRRIATAVMVWSWDHLSSKALIRDCPDALLVWNEAQKREAMDMHGVPEDRVVVTGAQCYDRWFGRRPTRSRAEFARHVGLPEDRPYVLWAGSALLPGTPPEPGFFLQWASQLRRSSDPSVRDVPILLRPHPARTADWATTDWRSIGNVVMFGGMPVDDQAREDYFESLYYSAAVVGITTSAFLEAAVVDRPVMAFYADGLQPEHEDSLHFQHLANPQDGLLTMAGELEEHARQLSGVLSGSTAELLQRQRRFVDRFVRPCGRDVAATSVAADALERLTAAPRVGAPAVTALGRFGWRQFQNLERSPRWRHLVLDEREIDREARETAKARLKEQEHERIRAAKQEALARKRAAKDQALAEKRAAKHSTPTAGI